MSNVWRVTPQNRRWPKFFEKQAAACEAPGDPARFQCDPNLGSHAGLPKRIQRTVHLELDRPQSRWQLCGHNVIVKCPHSATEVSIDAFNYYLECDYVFMNTYFDEPEPDVYPCPFCGHLLTHVRPGDTFCNQIAAVEAQSCERCGWTAWSTPTAVLPRRETKNMKENDHNRGALGTQNQFVQYRGRVYRLLWTGQTRYGQRATLAFQDGSKDFWVDAREVKPAADPDERPNPNRECDWCGHLKEQCDEYDCRCKVCGGAMR